MTDVYGRGLELFEIFDPLADWKTLFGSPRPHNGTDVRF